MSPSWGCWLGTPLGRRSKARSETEKRRKSGKRPGPVRLFRSRSVKGRETQRFRPRSRDCAAAGRGAPAGAIEKGGGTATDAGQCGPPAED